MAAQLNIYKKINIYYYANSHNSGSLSLHKERFTMFEFLLVLYFAADTLEDNLSDNEMDAIGDTFIEKWVAMPVIPRVGEYIDLGDSLKVIKVQHNITKRKVEVHCDVGLFEAVAAYAAEKSGWNLKNLGPSGKELFLRRLEQFETNQL
jgi:hypothetical protein